MSIQFDSVQAFLDMGGYGFFVWSSYGIWLVVMLWNVLDPWLRARAERRALALEQELDGLDDEP